MAQETYVFLVGHMYRAHSLSVVGRADRQKLPILNVHDDGGGYPRTLVDDAILTERFILSEGRILDQVLHVYWVIWCDTWLRIKDLLMLFFDLIHFWDLQLFGCTLSIDH